MEYNSKITITMTTGNDRFRTDEEIIDALKDLIKKWERRGVDDGIIQDANGNTVGTVVINDAD